MAGVLSFWGMENTSNQRHNMKLLFAFFVFTMLSLSTAFAAVPAQDGIDKQFDVSMFDQLPAMNLPGAIVDGASSSFDGSLATVDYKQITDTVTSQHSSGVVNDADAVDMVGIAGLVIFDKKSLSASPALEVGWSRSLN